MYTKIFLQLFYKFLGHRYLKRKHYGKYYFTTLSNAIKTYLIQKKINGLSGLNCFFTSVCVVFDDCVLSYSIFAESSNEPDVLVVHGDGTVVTAGTHDVTDLCPSGSVCVILPAVMGEFTFQCATAQHIDVLT